MGVFVSLFERFFKVFLQHRYRPQVRNWKRTYGVRKTHIHPLQRLQRLQHLPVSGDDQRHFVVGRG